MRNWLPTLIPRLPGTVQRNRTLSASPPLVLALGFLVLIFIGALVLSLPQAAFEPMSFFEALFMATSAVTVTGLTVVDPASELTHFGQITLAVLVQIGGMGFVTFAVIAAITMRKRISVNQQALALEAFNQTSVSRIRSTALHVFKIAALIELSAALILFLCWLNEMPWTTALYRALFHAVTAFNNAGYSLFHDSLLPISGDFTVVMTLSGLIILGGIGFSVLADVGQKKRWHTLLAYTKLILIGTLVLNLIGFAALWILEANNTKTLGMLGLGDQALAAWMQSAATRTAGFTTMDVQYLRDPTQLILILLMLIGGGSLSTASGIKIGTLIVLLAAVRSYIRQRQEVVLMERTVAPETVQKALALFLITGALYFAGVLALTLLEDLPLVSILFEVASALSTTGMSHGITDKLSMPGQFLIMVLMFTGRLGPLTLVYTLATRKRSRIRYPEGNFQVG
ncbi:TrkH family potassium uptake protein [Alcaligenes sp. SDU_A2]|uniref:TrkH family potassium uptake protein n=1 Tax=Alcaligenes sp. SDU_A2 TaxID=3136634 RepID=UPI00311D9788